MVKPNSNCSQRLRMKTVLLTVFVYFCSCVHPFPAVQAYSEREQRASQNRAVSDQHTQDSTHELGVGPDAAKVNFFPPKSQASGDSATILQTSSNELGPIDSQRTSADNKMKESNSGKLQPNSLHPKFLSQHNLHGLTKRSLELPMASSFSGMNQNFLGSKSTRASNEREKEIMLYARLISVLRRLKMNMGRNRSNKRSPDTSSMSEKMSESSNEDINKQIADGHQYFVDVGGAGSDEFGMKVEQPGVQEIEEDVEPDGDEYKSLEDESETDTSARKRFGALSDYSGISGMNQNFLRKRKSETQSQSQMRGMEKNILDKRFSSLSGGPISGFNQNFMNKRFDTLSSGLLSGFRQNHMKKRFNTLGGSRISGFEQNYLDKRFDSLGMSPMSGFNQNQLKKRFDSLTSSGFSGFNQNYINKRFDPLSSSRMSSFNQNYLDKKFDPLYNSGLSSFNQNFIKKRFNSLAGTSIGSFGQNFLDKRFDSLSTGSGLSGFNQNHLKKRFGLFSDSRISGFGQNHLDKKHAGDYGGYLQNYMKQENEKTTATDAGPVSFSKRFDDLISAQNNNGMHQRYLKKRHAVNFQGRVLNRDLHHVVARSLKRAHPRGEISRSSVEKMNSPHSKENSKTTLNSSGRDGKDSLTGDKQSASTT